MFDGATTQQKYGLVAVVALTVAVSFAAGTMVSGGSSPTGNVAVGDAASSDAVKQKIQSFMDQQLQRQRQQFSMMAGQNPNISEDDLSVDATITDVTESEFGSLQKVTVSITGTVPARTGRTQSLDRKQTFYVSQDGRYLFQEPTDLEQQRQQPQRPTGAQPPTGGQ